MDLYEIRKKAREKREAEEKKARAEEEAARKPAGDASEGGEKPKKPRKKAAAKKTVARKPKKAKAEKPTGPEAVPVAEETPSAVEEEGKAVSIVEPVSLAEEEDVPLDVLMQQAFEAETAGEPVSVEPAVPEPDIEPVAEEDVPAEPSGTGGDGGGEEPALPGPVSGEDDEELEDENIVEYLAFMLSEEEYAVRVSDIKEIIRPQKITMVPRAPEFVEGIFSLRGVIIPVFDIKKRLGFADTERDRAARILIVSDGGDAQGIIVDRVTGVARLKEDRIEPPPTVIGGVEAEYLEGIGRLDGRLLILFNTARILSMEG